MEIDLIYKSEFNNSLFREKLSIPEEYDCVRIMKELIDGLYKQRSNILIGINYKIVRIPIYNIIKTNNHYDLYRLTSIQTDAPTHEPTHILHQYVIE